jgi:hypothetical protein
MDFDDGRYSTPSEFSIKAGRPINWGLSISLEPRIQSRTRGPVDSFEQRMKGKSATLTISYVELQEIIKALGHEMDIVRRVVRQNGLAGAVAEMRERPASSEDRE